MRSVRRKEPQKNPGFSWGRFPLGDTGVVAYRLFRRDAVVALTAENIRLREENARLRLPWWKRVLRKAA